MKRLFTFIAAVAVAMAAVAKDYTDNLAITLGDDETPVTSTTTISIDKQDNGKYTIKLNQFSFMGALLIGDVTMTDVEGVDDAQGFTNYSTTQTATITNGDETGIMGMLGGKIDVTVAEGSRSKGDKFYAVISLTVPGVGDVHAVFGDNKFPGSATSTNYVTTMTVNIDNSNIDVVANAAVAVEENADGTSNFIIENISFNYQGQQINVGTLKLENVSVTSAGIYKLFAANQFVKMQPDEDDSKPVYMTGEIRNGQLYANLVIGCCPTADKFIAISLGDGAYTIGQLPNSGFESFHEASYSGKTSMEPDGWHSFMSATGSLANFVKGTPHTGISDEARPGSKGSKSVLVYSSDKIMGQIPNGTITTGQMNAGAISAADPKNNAFVDFSNTETDAKGDPFYATVDALPDSISLWVKFVQGEPSADYPYATVSAAITDGTKYQDPEDKTYNNIVAKAKNAQIESLDGAWQRITVPFDYESYLSNMAKANAMLVTISTNATPGKGSGSDKLNVDDVELIYNADLSSVSFEGEPVEGFSQDKCYYEGLKSDKRISTDDIDFVTTGKASNAIKTIIRSEEAPGTATVLITVVSADCKTVKRYTLKCEEPTSGINAVESSFGNSSSAVKIYNLNGQRVSEMQKGNVYIIKNGNKVVKVANK